MRPPALDTINRAIGLELGSTRYRYSERDAALYALGIGASSDPLDLGELKFVYENCRDGFQVIPTFAVLFAKSLFELFFSGEIAGIQFEPMMLVHGEQQLEICQPLPPAARVTSTIKVAEILDKGSGMLVVIDIESVDEAGAKLCVNRTSVFIRGLGGFGGARGSSVRSDPPPRPPDIVHEERTRSNQALLYRLSGDTNPLHVDPQMAAVGNYPRPILHGLCTFGFAARALLKHCCANDAQGLRAIGARFASHVFPGETLSTEIWHLGGDEISFQTKVKERDTVVLSHARARLRT